MKRLQTRSFIYLTAHFFLLCILPGYGQSELKKQDEDAAFLFGIEYGFDLSGGDLKDRFGNCLEVGGRLGYLFRNSAFQAGIRASYYFGDTVKQDVLAHLIDANGHIIGINGDYASVKLRMRAYSFGVFASMVVPNTGMNARSGIRLDLGVNAFQHWIRLQDDYNTVAQFDDPYYKGYDRLSNGMAVSEFIGYQYMSRNRRINFYVGIELQQGFTQSRRDYDYATQSSETGLRLDLLHGIKAAWILPIFRESQPDQIYY